MQNKRVLKLNVLTSEQVIQLNEQKRIDKEIEEYGIVLGWKPVGIIRKNLKIKEQTIVRYKNTKVMKFEKGYVLLCQIYGCYNPSHWYDVNICNQHSKKETLTQRFCTSKTICTSQANFGYEENKPLFCKPHSSSFMIDVRNKKCKYPNCRKQPQFGILGGKTEFCFKHKTEQMTDISHKKCIHPECDIRARYEYFGETVPKYCSNHKLEFMVDIERTKCGHKGCLIGPTFGFKNETVRYCKSHKLEGMKDLKNKKCSQPGCEVLPTYNYEGLKAKYCKIHKNQFMIDVINKRCIFENCNIQPAFGYPGDESLYCNEHKLDKMINIKSKRCIVLGCNTLPTYGYLYSSNKIHCIEHSTSNEYSKHKRYPKCSILKCSNIAKFIDEDDLLLQPTKCEEHKLSTTIKMVEKICSLCNLNIYMPDNKNICAVCGNYRVKIVRHHKEHDLKRFLSEHNILFVHDKHTHSNGSAHRPDFLIDSGFGKIILECDEFQHKNKYYTKEYDRMKTIYNDVQLIKINSEVLFIRYNPDNYEGLQCELNAKLEYLHFLLLHFIKLEKLNTKLGVIYLFYDGYDGNPQVEPIVIDEIMKKSIKLIIKNSVIIDNNTNNTNYEQSNNTNSEHSNNTNSEQSNNNPNNEIMKKSLKLNIKK